MRVLIIAEAGVNHNGDIDIAKELIKGAAKAGADIVKFQTFKAENLVTRSAARAQYQIETIGGNESQYDMLKKLEMSDKMHKSLLAYASDVGIKFLSTGFDIASLDYLRSLGQSIFKIPSGEITNLPYLRHVGGFDKHVILSTGMANMSEVADAINVIERSGTKKNKITVLHCTSEYPAPMSEVNLLAMKAIAKELSVAVGYSDHTLGIEIPIAAVAMGAIVIEKHFTLDKSMTGPDHRASLNLAELHSMISAIRNIELAMGDGIKRPSESEQKNKYSIRKSIVAKRYIAKGEKFTIDNIDAKRPGSGISPMEWDSLIGTTAMHEFKEDEAITK